MKQRCLKAVSAFVIILCSATAAGAAASQGQQARLGRAPVTRDDIRILNDFSRCTVRWDGTRARRVLAMEFRTDAFERQMRRIAQDNWRCLPRGGMLRFGAVLFAGGIAEALLHNRRRDRNLTALVAYDPAQPPLQARDEVEMMSLCTVRAVPDQVAALLATPVGSSEEAQAIAALMPQVSQCLASGASVRLNQMGLRATLALAAYRLAEQGGAARAALAGPPETGGTIR